MSLEQTGMPRVGMLATVRNRWASSEPSSPSEGQPQARSTSSPWSTRPRARRAEEQPLWEREPRARLLEPTALPDVDRCRSSKPSGCRGSRFSSPPTSAREAVSGRGRHGALAETQCLDPDDSA